MRELELIKDLAASLDVEAKEIPLGDEFEYQDGVSFKKSGDQKQTPLDDEFEYQDNVTFQISGDHAVSLGINDLEMTNLEQVIEFSKLETLILCRNQIADLSPLSNLSQLSELYLPSNQIADLSPLSNLSQLSKLNLFNNQIADISPLSNLSQLSKLSLSSNRIADLSTLSNLSQLSELSLPSNQIADLSPLSNLSQLSELYLFNNEITDLSPLSNLSQLSKLYLFNNQIADLSPLSNLSQLSELDLSENQIADLSPLSNLSQLSGLDLSENQIADLSPLSNLSQLSELDLSENQIADLSPLSNLSQLSKLNLFTNQIADLSPLTKIKKLKIDTRENPIEILGITWFQKPRTVTIKNVDEFVFYIKNYTLITDGKDLISPPVELIEKPNALHVYLNDCGNLQAIEQLKILVLGEGAAGKTSLIKTLTGKKFDSNEPQTHGINITKLPIDIDDKAITTRIWDFGGQEIMHATHKFFLSRRSLFVVVLDGRRDEDPEHWLAHARTYGDNPPTIVVLNKIDANPNYGVDRQELQRKYPFIRAFVRTSAATGKGLDKLKQALSTFAAQVPMIRMQLPESWVSIMQELEDSDEPYFNADRIKAICVEKGLHYKKQQRYMIDFLNDLGVAIHLPQRQTNDTFVLNPEWATQGVYRLINHPEVEKNKGFIPDDEATLDRYLSQPWFPDQKAQPDHLKHFDYPSHKHNFLIESLKHFELAFAVERPTPGVLAPTHLVVDPKPFTFKHDEPLQLRISYEGFLPPSILPRLMVRRYEELNLDHCGRYLMVARSPEGEAEMTARADKSARRLTVRVGGPTKHGYLAAIRDTLRIIHEDFDTAYYTMEIGCRCHVCRHRDQPHFYPLRSLMFFFLKGNTEIPCDVSLENVSIATILGEVFQGPVEADGPVMKRLDEIRDKLTDIELKVDAPETEYDQIRKLVDTKLGINGFKFDWLGAIELWFKKRAERKRGF